MERCASCLRFRLCALLLARSHIPRAQLSSMLDETSLCAALRHPNIVKYFGVAINPPEVMLVFEYCFPGNLYVFLPAANPQVYLPFFACSAASCLIPLPACLCNVSQEFTFRTRLELARQGASALAYLHECDPPIVHRDIKVRACVLT